VGTTDIIAEHLTLTFSLDNDKLVKIRQIQKDLVLEWVSQVFRRVGITILSFSDIASPNH